MSYLALLIRTFTSTHVKKEKFSSVQAIAELRQGLKKPEIESFDLILRLGVDPTNGEHMVKGNAYLPYGTGNSKRIAVFIPESQKAFALSLGASIAGNDLLAQVKENKFDFDLVLATAEMFDTLKPLSRTLGVKGFMPTVRNNTLIPFENLEEVMKKLTRGVASFRMTKYGIVQTSFGKTSFPDQEIMSNLKTLMVTILGCKPKHLKKRFIQHAYITSTYGKSVYVDVNSLDPGHFKSDFINVV